MVLLVSTPCCVKEHTPSTEHEDWEGGIEEQQQEAGTNGKYRTHDEASQPIPVTILNI
jgi:hypothetical protein